MFYRSTLFIIFLLFLTNCTTETLIKNKRSINPVNSYSNKGFALIYNENLYNDKIISKKINNRSLIIFQKHLKTNTLVKITNILNNKSIIGTVGKNSTYPEFNKKAKTYDEEKNVAGKAPVNNISINDLNLVKKQSKKKLISKFSYTVKIADFHFYDTALVMINRIKNESSVKNPKIKKISNKKYRVYLGPFYNINSLQKSYNDVSILKFENIEIIKND